MSGRWKGEKQLQVQQRGRPMPFTEEQMRQIYNTNIIDFAVRNGFEIEKSDKATVHVKHNGGLYLFKHGRGYYSFTEERGGDIVEFAMNYLGLKKREAMEQILGCRAYERTAHVVSPQEKAERGTMVLPPRDTDDRRVFAYLTKTMNQEMDQCYDIVLRYRNLSDINQKTLRCVLKRLEQAQLEEIELCTKEVKTNAEDSCM